VRTMSRIGFVMLIGGAVMLALGATGIAERVPALVMGTVLTVIGTTIWLIGRSIGKSFERDVALVRELATRGVRRTGTVKDVVPYASAHGGAVFQPEGAQMVLRIELDPEGGSRRTVTCHVVENSEDAKRRIGSEVVVLEHPENSNIRAIEGYLPNGRKAS
jgi:hypothetical protein